MADKQEAFETFEFDLEPIRGFPELRWTGKRAFTATQFFPAQRKESYGDPVEGWMNKLFWGDNIQVMSHLLRDFRHSVDLIYLDPPFDSKAEYKKKVRLKIGKADGDHNSFEEKQYNDIWGNDGYLQFVYERLVLCRELLSPTGSIYLHVDWHKSSHIRLILDEIFGAGSALTQSSPGFRNEVIWCYSGGGVPTNELPRKHDNLYWYSKSAEWKFNPVYRAYSEGTLQRGRTAVKGENAKLREDGTPVNDWWSDVKKITSPTDPEKLYYPTQKSEELLERIVQMHTDEGDLVFDCFMGSGTAQAVAIKMGRRFLGADINLGAIETTTKRIAAIISRRASGGIAIDENSKWSRAGFEVYNVNNYDIFRNPVEAKELIKEAMELQPLPTSSVFDGQRDQFLVKIMPVNRIATRQDLNEVINGMDFKAYERRQAESPSKIVDRIMLVCMGHEPDIGEQLKLSAKPFNIEVEVVDLIRDKANLHFKRQSDAKLVIKDGNLEIAGFYPLNLLQKLSMDTDAVEDWRQLVETIKVDWNYDGAVLSPELIDAPDKNDLVSGRYPIPDDASTIRVKITDLLSESWEGEIENG
ncbi:DNA methyltransferase [Jannaschia marina]|uniref:DNA methyltransferase n=1 Tax=Jannaschia marina TaxID=2741674 RepID=UPI0015C8A486|nr:site-specific DNA-methyltransferase [Jannaschia marina]